LCRYRLLYILYIYVCCVAHFWSYAKRRVVFSFDRLMGRIDYDNDGGLAIHNIRTTYPPRRAPRIPTRIYIIYGLSISLFKRLGKKKSPQDVSAHRYSTQDKRMLYIIILLLYIVGRQGGKERTRVGTWLETLNDRSIDRRRRWWLRRCWPCENQDIPFMNIVREFKCRQRNNNCHRTPLFSHYRTTIIMLLATRSFYVIINTFYYYYYYLLSWS